MGLSDVTGVFSRYYVVGFFLPAFAVLVLASQVLSSHVLPDAFERYAPGTQIAILGGTAIFMGLALVGLNYPILRAFEGYPLVALASWLRVSDRSRCWRPVAWATAGGAGWLIGIQAGRRAALRKLRDQSPDPGDQGLAAWRLDRNYPRRRRDLLPTRFGNVVRAFELHSSHRWGLDAIAAQPRIDALLSSKEHDIQADARSEVSFFVNLVVLSTALGVGWATDLVAFRADAWYELLPAVVPFAVAWCCYRASIGAAQRWGAVVRSAVDLHRLELYTALGIRAPETFEDERLAIGPAVSRCVLHGNRLPDELRAESATPIEEEWV